MKWPKWFPLHDPAFRWGLCNPFGPPPPWWPDERRQAHFAEHGVPWETKVIDPGWWCPDCGEWIDDLSKAKFTRDNFTVHPWCN